MGSIPVDLRSDTVTLPTTAMRDAMYNAVLGDDLRGDDPTVQRLEAMAAERLGKEAGLLVISGTMGNLVCLLAHCQPGDQVIVGDQSHIFLYESANGAAFGGLQIWALPNQSDGLFEIPPALECRLKPRFEVCPVTRLICLENTHNQLGGTVISPDRMAMIGRIARRCDVSVHLDGARLFNAAVALGVDVKDLVSSVDTVTFCLSKGLSAPLGSLVCGSREFIERARKVRNRLGGGMRQAGTFAAAGIVALQKMVDRLAEDHANARKLAEGIASIDGFAVDLAGVHSNIVTFELTTEELEPSELVARMERRGVRIQSTGYRLLRAVTHRGVDGDDVQTALCVIRDAVQGLRIDHR